MNKCSSCGAHIARKYGYCQECQRAYNESRRKRNDGPEQLIRMLSNPHWLKIIQDAVDKEHVRLQGERKKLEFELSKNGLFIYAVENEDWSVLSESLKNELDQLIDSTRKPKLLQQSTEGGTMK